MGLIVRGVGDVEAGLLGGWLAVSSLLRAYFRAIWLPASRDAIDAAQHTHDIKSMICLIILQWKCKYV